MREREREIGTITLGLSGPGINGNEEYSTFLRVERGGGLHTSTEAIQCVLRLTDSKDDQSLILSKFSI